MKRQKKILIIAFYLIQVIAVFFGGYSVGKIKENSACSNSDVSEGTSAEELEENEMKHSVYISGMLAPYKHFDREISLGYFYNLDSTSTYEQIVEEIGEPNGEYGSGMKYKYYEIDDDLYVSMSFYCNDRSYENVNLIRLCTGKEILDVIFPNIEEMPIEE